MSPPSPSPRFPFLPDHNELHRIRYDKAAAMRAEGLDPFPAKFEATHQSAQLLAEEEEWLEREDRTASLLGRVMTIRSFGKSAFFHLRDDSGQIQVFIDKKRLPEEDFAVFKAHLDGGDLVGVQGHLFKTRTGETSLYAHRLRFMAKAVRPLPEKWKGLTDKETRYRQRYVDLIANPQVAEVFRQRSRLVSGMRRWLDDAGFLEVETPMMQPIYGGASARPFSTHHNALDMQLYLRIAPELYLKRLAVGGMQRIYEINRNFRNEGISTQHNPEFTMLELYAAGWDCARMMDFVEDLVRAAAIAATGSTVVPLDGGEHDLALPFERVTILDAVKRHLGLDLNWGMTAGEVRANCGDYAVPSEIQSGVDAVLFLFEEHVEEHLAAPTFVTEFPKAVSPLAKSKPGEPEVADRFELYIRRMELANGFSELNDPAEQYQRFAEQVERRKGGDMEAVGVIDEDYIRALEHGMPPTAGLGVGIDRLAMVATGAASIRDVILFPLMKPLPADHDHGADAE